MVKICWHCMKTYEDNTKYRCDDCRQILSTPYNDKQLEIANILSDKGYNIESFFIFNATYFTNGARINFAKGINIPTVPNGFIKENVDREHHMMIFTDDMKSEDENLDILYDWSMSLPQFYTGIKTIGGNELKYDITMMDEYKNNWGLNCLTIEEVSERVINNIENKGYMLIDAFAYYSEEQQELDNAINKIKIKKVV